MLSFLVLVQQLFFAVHCQNVVSAGTTLTIDDIAYYVPPQPVATAQHELPEGLGDSFFVPVTVVASWNGLSANYSLSDLEALRSSFIEKDDVFSDSFFKVLYIQGKDESSHQSNARLIGKTTVVSHVLQHEDFAIPTGPYFISSKGLLYQAYRLYSDFQGAFSLASIQTADYESSSVLLATLPDQYLSVAVPSRLYYTQTPEKPLAGVRLGVKDIFDVRGLKTALGNRAWEALYAPANDTATAVKRLVDAGAVVVGKMKTSQFAIGETATADWIDVHAPFNPRGDGYQDPSSSSAGPAAGIASYEWLDIALGSDTGGSIRSPSQVNGVFGNRPSHGLVDLDHTMPIAPELDTAGLLTRDPKLWNKASKILYSTNITQSSALPTNILTLDLPTTINSSFSAQVHHFLSNLSDFLSANTTSLNISSSWTSSNPSLPNLNTYFNKTYDIITSSRQAQLLQPKFYADYAAFHDGRIPFINPSVKARWDVAENYTPDSLSTELEKLDFFTTWFNSYILPPDPETCSKFLLVYVRGEPRPRYRNTYLSGVTPPSAGFSASRIAVFGRVPDFVVPIGEVVYDSVVSGREEVLPLTLDFVVRRGCDGVLFELVERLYEAGVLRGSLVGRSLVSGGEVLR